MRLLFLYLSLSFISKNLQAQSSISYLENMVESISAINTLEYELHAQELVNGKIFYMHSRVKLQNDPFYFYNYIIKPDMGVEILFTHKNQYALINTNGFPFISLKLNPLGRLIRRDKHHTLFDAGFDSFKNIVLASLELLKQSPEKYIVDLGVKQIDGKKCKGLALSNPDFSFSEYIVQKGEDIESIAKKFSLSSYLILIENNLGFYNDIKLGDKILLPNSYAEQFEIWIDLESALPIVQKVFVNNELFEHYEFKNIIVNPKFSIDEFDRSNTEYNF